MDSFVGLTFVGVDKRDGHMIVTTNRWLINVQRRSELNFLQFWRLVCSSHCATQHEARCVSITLSYFGYLYIVEITFVGVVSQITKR